MPDNEDRVLGRPSKAFFIDMITRDIGVGQCILDLVYNAIDQAIERSNLDVMKTLTNGAGAPGAAGGTVSVAFSRERLLIEDTCGGIPINEARNEIFLFGNPIQKTGFPGLSVYGIGMKRAFFKLGNFIQMESFTEGEYFAIDIDVDKWKNQGDDNWDFRFQKYESPKKTKRNMPPGTRIEITGFRDGIGERLSQISFQNDLELKLAATYALFLKAGIKVTVNDSPVVYSLPTVGREAKIVPARKQFRHEDVEILIIAGITPKEDKRAHGWYVFCNGRMVLESDKSRNTGWGEQLPSFHSKYNHFVGYVYFRSDEVRKLPWTTTKDAVVYDSPVYQAALPEMQILSRPILDFLNDLYPGEMDPEGVLEREFLEKARRITIDQLAKKDTSFFVRGLREAKIKKENRLEWIRYRKPAKDIERARTCIGKKQMSPSQIGSHTFDYFLKQECD